MATNVAWLLGHLHDALSSNPVTRTSGKFATIPLNICVC